MWWIVVLLPCVLSIRFEYELVKHEFMCFSEEVEKQTRYQIIVKGQKASYLLQVFQSEQSIHQNSDGQMYMKYYSAYAQLNDNILFCIGNMDVDEGNLVEIQFYHGMHLEEEGGMKGIEAIVENLQHMQNFIKISYSMHSQSLLYRESLLEQIVVVLSVLVFVFFFLVLVTRYCVLTRTIRYLKHRKII